MAQGITGPDAHTAHRSTRGSTRTTHHSTRGAVAPPTLPREERRNRRAGAIADSVATVPSLRRIEGAGVLDAGPPLGVDSPSGLLPLVVLPGENPLGKFAEDSDVAKADGADVQDPALEQTVLFDY